MEKHNFQNIIGQFFKYRTLQEFWGNIGALENLLSPLCHYYFDIGRVLRSLNATEISYYH